MSVPDWLVAFRARLEDRRVQLEESERLTAEQLAAEKANRIAGEMAVRRVDEQDLTSYGARFRQLYWQKWRRNIDEEDRLDIQRQQQREEWARSYRGRPGPQRPAPNAPSWAQPAHSSWTSAGAIAGELGQNRRRVRTWARSRGGRHG